MNDLGTIANELGNTDGHSLNPFVRNSMKTSGSGISHTLKEVIWPMGWIICLGMGILKEEA